MSLLTRPCSNLCVVRSLCYMLALGLSRGRVGIRGEIDSLRAQSGADDDMRTPRAGESLREFYRLNRNLTHLFVWDAAVKVLLHSRTAEHWTNVVVQEWNERTEKTVSRYTFHSCTN